MPRACRTLAASTKPLATSAPSFGQWSICFTFLPAKLPPNHHFELDTSPGFVLLLVLDDAGRELAAECSASVHRSATSGIGNRTSDFAVDSRRHTTALAVGRGMRKHRPVLKS